MLPRTKTLKSKFFAGFHSFIFLERLFYDKIYTFISIVYEPVLSLRGARAARLVQLKIYAVFARRGLPSLPASFTTALDRCSINAIAVYTTSKSIIYGEAIRLR